MDLSNLSILYVEDEIALTDLMQELLGDEIKALYVAHDGEEGLALFEQYKPDIVISDVYMPRLSGLNLSAIIKKRYPEQPIILLTAFNNLEDLKKSIEIGIDFYINKPITDEEQLHRPLDQIAQRIDQKSQLELLANQLETLSKDAAIGEVISQIAHQWRQPLSIISSKANTLKLTWELGEAPDPQLIQFLDLVREQVSYLSQTITDFRNFFRPKELPVSFSLQTQLEKVHALISPRLYQEKVDLVLPETTILLCGYPNKLTHVLLNLINNAREAFHHVTVPARCILITIEENEQKCIIHVQDSAKGIKEANLENIFQPYFTTKSEEIGTGLGLFMSKEFIVGQMGGKITVQNTSFVHHGQELYGACFHIELPKVVASADQ